MYLELSEHFQNLNNYNKGALMAEACEEQGSCELLDTAQEPLAELTHPQALVQSCQPRAGAHFSKWVT